MVLCAIKYQLLTATTAAARRWLLTINGALRGPNLICAVCKWNIRLECVIDSCKNFIPNHHLCTASWQLYCLGIKRPSRDGSVTKITRLLRSSYFSQWGCVKHAAAARVSKEAVFARSFRGLPYMTSVNNFEFSDPLTPRHIQNSANFVTFVCFLGTPSPCPLQTSYMEAPLERNFHCRVHKFTRYPRSKACQEDSRTLQQPSTAFLSSSSGREQMPRPQTPAWK